LNHAWLERPTSLDEDGSHAVPTDHGMTATTAYVIRERFGTTKGPFQPSIA